MIRGATGRWSFDLGAFRFEDGQRLTRTQLAFECWGKLNQARDNAVLVAHALTGTSHVARNGDVEAPGWWDFLVAPGAPIDPEKYFIICSNVLGGCSGSTGPGSPDPVTGRPYGLAFPTVTIRDMVRAQRQLVEALGVCSLRCVIGASMGGMQALEWAARFPDQVQSIAVIAAPGRAYPQSIAYRSAQRRAIMMDPDWHGGNYYGKSAPAIGVELARLIGFITYRSDREFSSRFGRQIDARELLALQGKFEIEKYLQHQGRKLASRFDANTYLYLSKAMDLHDLGYGCASYEEGLARIRARTLVIGFDSDILFPTYQQQEIVRLLQRAGRPATYREIRTLYGHDAFLLEKDQLVEEISRFLANPH